MTRWRPIPAAATLLLLGAGEAHAYIDLGTGSYVVQVVLASLLGIGFAVKAYWQRLRGLFDRRRVRDDDSRPGD